MADEAEIPEFGMMQVREPAADQRADEVQRQGGAFVAVDEPPGIRSTRRFVEGGRIDVVPEVAGELDAVTLLGQGGSRFRVLPREATDPDDAAAGSVHQHQRHLQQDLQLVRQRLGRARPELLRAIPALEQEPFPPGGLGELALETLHLPRGDQGGSEASSSATASMASRSGYVG